MGLILRPGGDPPVIVPYCAICDRPVQRMSIFPVRSAYYCDIEGECCGRRQGAHVSIDEIFRLKRTNDKLYLVVGKHHSQHIRAQASNPR